jgi:cyclophilin family peptidyl-prolyl cis-trans isomerase
VTRMACGTQAEDQPSRPSGKHTIFGRISSGMTVIQKMGLVKTGDQDR